MKKVLFILFTIIFTGCNNQSIDTIKLSENGQLAKLYLQDMGYEVVSFESESSIVFTKSRLLELPDKQIWGVQYSQPDEYLNKEIDKVSFMIKNHPLDNQYNMGKTNATVLLLKQKVIGGWSFPHSTEPLVGGVYSIDGKTLEEIHGDWQEWSKRWDSKYGK